MGAFGRNLQLQAGPEYALFFPPLSTEALACLCPSIPPEHNGPTGSPPKRRLLERVEPATRFVLDAVPRRSGPTKEGSAVRRSAKLEIGLSVFSRECFELPSGVVEYRIGQAAELLGVSPDTVRRWVDAGRIKATVGVGGRRYVEGVDLARLAIEIAGDHIPAHPRRQSARNRFLGIVTRVVKDKVAAQVEIQAGPHRFVALITREAADELELAPGVVADAVVKATNVGVEIPAQI